MSTKNIELLIPEGMSACGDEKGLIDLQVWFKGGIFLKIIKSRGDEDVLKFEDPEDALSETIKKYEKTIIKYISLKQLPIGIEIIKEGTIKPGSKICAIHSGGLQGNRSLPAGTLVY